MAGDVRQGCCHHVHVTVYVTVCVMVIMCGVLQDGRSCATGASLESSGSNHAAPARSQDNDSPTMQTADADQAVPLPSEAGAAGCNFVGTGQTVGGADQPQSQAVHEIAVSYDLGVHADTSFVADLLT